MSLEKLEHIVNLSFKGDMSSAQSALNFIGAEIDDSILEGTYLLTHLPFFTPEIIMKRPILSIIIFLILSFTLFPIIRPNMLPARMAMKSVIIPIFFLSDTIFKKIIS